jgi:hypothetical protein
MAYRAVDHYVYERVRQFLQRHKVQSRGTSRFTDATVFGKLACCVSVSDSAMVAPLGAGDAILFIDTIIPTPGPQTQ